MKCGESLDFRPCSVIVTQFNTLLRLKMSCGMGLLNSCTAISRVKVLSLLVSLVTDLTSGSLKYHQDFYFSD